MSLRTRLEDDVKSALKGGDRFRADVLRFLLANVHNREIERRGTPLTDGDILDVAKKEAKKRREAIELFEKGGRSDLADKEKKELAILGEYLPAELSREAIERVVGEVIREGSGDFGAVMREAMKRLKGQADGKLVSDIIKQKLGA